MITLTLIGFPHSLGHELVNDLEIPRLEIHFHVLPGLIFLDRQNIGKIAISAIQITLKTALDRAGMRRIGNPGNVNADNISHVTIAGHTHQHGYL